MRFLDGLRTSLMMSAAGASDADAGAGGGGGAPAAGAGAAAAAPAAGAEWSFPTDKAFAEYLPKEYRADASLRDIKNFDGLVKGFVSASKMVGLDKGQVLALPAANDDAKAWDGVYAKLGRPESVDKYEIPKLEGGKEYSDVDKAMQAKLLPILHEAGLSQRQLNTLVPKWNAVMGELGQANSDAEKANYTKAETALKTEWGGAYTEKSALAIQARDHLVTALKLGDDFKSAMEAKDANGNALGNHPAFAKIFAHLGQLLKEDGVLGTGGPGDGGGALSPAEAQQKINSIRGDAKHPYNDKKHAGHRDAVEDMERLHKMAYPEPAQQ